MKNECWSLYDFCDLISSFKLREQCKKSIPTPFFRCRPGWYGVLCRRKLKRPLSTVAVLPPNTRRKNNGGQSGVATLASRIHQEIGDDSQLMINQKSLTSESVGIVLPNIKAKVRFSLPKVDLVFYKCCSSV